MEDAAVGVLVRALHAQAVVKAGSLKYATLVLHLVNKYSRQMLGQRGSVDAIVSCHTTFLSKTIKTALKKWK